MALTKTYVIDYTDGGDTVKEGVEKLDDEFTTLYSIVDGAHKTHYGAAAPANKQTGTLWINSADKNVYYWDGSAWTAITKRPYCLFRAVLAVDQDTATGVAETVLCLDVAGDYNFDYDSAYDETTGIFTAPIDGIYEFHGYSGMVCPLANCTAQLKLLRTAEEWSNATLEQIAGYDAFLSVHAFIPLSAAEEVKIQATITGGAGKVRAAKTYFEGRYIGPTPT